MNKIKNTLIKAKNHVMTHKFAYTMTVVAAAAVVGNQRNLKRFDGFLREKGINPIEFYTPEWYEEIKEGA